MSATRRQVHTLTPFAQVRATTITYPVEDLQNDHTNSRSNHSGSQLVKKTRHIKEPKMASQLGHAS